MFSKFYFFFRLTISFIAIICYVIFRCFVFAIFHILHFDSKRSTFVFQCFQPLLFRHPMEILNENFTSHTYEI